MEVPSGRPQADDAYGQGDVPLQPQAEDPVNIVSASNPPSLPGMSSRVPQKVLVPSRTASGHAGKRQLFTTNTSNSNKVAIPRQRSGAVPRYSRRVPLACETCRQRKTKCSGDTPVCRQCMELRVDCRYPVSWRERTKGQLTKLSAKSDDYENLLRDICNIVDGRTSDRIKSLLEKYSGVGDGTTVSLPSDTGSHGDNEFDDESAISSIGSLDAIDRVEEDVNRTANSRATGYMGKNSEVTWLQRLRKETEQRARRMSGTYETKSESEFALHSMNYHLDDIDISVPGPVNPYWMPLREVADRLFEDYIETIHPLFPIISRTLFRSQYKNFYDNAARPGDKWLAILNLIFAISSRHAHLTQAPWCGDDHDHLVYLTRARALSMNDDVLFTHPDLQQVQVESLMSFYLLATDQINRAWRIASLALRSGISLGLNMKNTSHGTTDISKEARYRVWWCLYTFEHMLGIMTGRVTGISDGVCTTPMPLPFDEDQFQDPTVKSLLNNLDARQGSMEPALASTNIRQMSLNPRGGREARYTDKQRDMWLKGIPPSGSLGFLCYVDLAVIVQEIVNRVYSLDCTMIPWSHIENRMGELRARIDLWYSNLPEAYDFNKRDEQESNLSMVRDKLFLAFHYHSARITLGRPCLCRRDARLDNSPEKQPSFSHELAVISLESALSMLALIPDNPDAVRLYQLCPWWCILHYLMQATTILLIELSFGNVHMPHKESQFLASLKKGIRWLYAMSAYSLASRRSWELCDSNFRRIATGMNYDVSDIPSDSDSDSQTINPSPAQKQPPPTVTLTTLPVNPLTDTLRQNQQQPQQQPSPVPSRDPSTQPPSSLSPRCPGVSGTVDPVLTSFEGVSDVYFPYDPITGEFIRSFFPNSTDEDPWDES